MNIYQFLHFITFLIYCYLIILVLHKDSKSWLNRICAALFSCFAIWSFEYVFILNPNTSKDMVRLLDNICSLGWIGFAHFFLWFTLTFTEKKKILKTRIIFPLIFIPPFLLIYKQCTGFLTVDYIKEFWGWAGVLSDSIWTYLFYADYLLFIGISLYLIFNFRRRVKGLLRKKQTKLIFTTAIIALIIGTLVGIILPELNVYRIPPTANIITLIWAFGMVYAIVKYKFMAITPALVAENIISTMADSLVLLDREGNIISVNKATLGLSGYRNDELEGKSVEMLFTEKDFKSTLLDKAIKKEAIRNYELGFKAKKKDIIPTLFSSSTIMD